MRCPHCHAEAHPGACEPSLLAPLPEWRQELQQRLQAYRERRGRRGVEPWRLTPARPPHHDAGGRVLDFRRAAAEPALAVAAAPDPVADPVAPPPRRRPTAAPVAAPELRLVEAPPPLEIPPLPELPPPPPVTALAEPVASSSTPAPETVLESTPPRVGAMLQIPLPLAATRAAAAPRTPSASWRRRLHSGILDALVVTLASLLFSLAGWASLGFAAPDVDTLRHLLPALVAVPPLLAALYLFACFSAGGVTWGMRHEGLEIRSLDGALTRRALQRRACACLVSLAALGLGYFWMYCDADRLTWHDYISRTYVVPAETD